MKVKVLAENTALNGSFVFEHGLSLYIETKQHRILVDMGQTNLFKKNAELLGVDLSKVDIAVLSHGHYDHSGGLKRFLEINSIAKVYLSEFAFEQHYRGIDVYIGMDQSLVGCDRFVFVDDFIEIDSELSIYSCNERETVTPIDSAGLTLFEDGSYKEEDFRHEHYLVINEKGKKTVVSGCSHKGIVNITNWLSPDALIGGFHFSKVNLNGAGKARLKEVSEYLMSNGGKFYTCHCTGIEQYGFMKTVMGDSLDYISAGTEFEII